MASVRVYPEKGFANMVVAREDGDTLSLSSVDRSLIHWGADNSIVRDYGWVMDAKQYHEILTAFLILG